MKRSAGGAPALVLEDSVEEEDEGEDGEAGEVTVVADAAGHEAFSPERECIALPAGVATDGTTATVSAKHSKD